MPAVVIPAAFGVLAGLLAITVSAMETKFAAAVALGLCGLVGWLWLGPRGRGRALVAVLIFGISIKLSKTLFLIETSRWQYLPFSAGAAGLTVGAGDIAAALLLIGVARRRTPTYRPAGISVVWTLTSGPLLFMAAGLASLYNAEDHALLTFELWRQALLLLTMLAATNLPSDRLRDAVKMLAISVVMQGAIAFVQYATDADLGLGFLGEQELVQEPIGFELQARAVGTIGHSNILAYFFEITLPLMLALAMAQRRLAARLPYLAAIGAGLIGVLVTLSRAAWIAVPLTLLPVFLIYQGRALLRLRGALQGIGLAILGSAALAAAWPTIAERVFSDDAGSASARGPLNRSALSVWEQFPVFGVGLNNLSNGFPQLDRTFYTRVFVPYNHVVHNMYLWALAEVGVVGFPAFLWMLASVLVVGWRLRRSPDPLARALGIGGAFGLLAQMIHGMFDPGYRISLPISNLLAVEAGLMGAAWLRHRGALAAAAPRPAAMPVEAAGLVRPPGPSRASAYR